VGPVFRGNLTRSGHEPVVIVPLAEYESMKETEYLLRNPSNAAALRRSIAELVRGDVHERDLIDPAPRPAARPDPYLASVRFRPTSRLAL
jgi:Antitoxin Phd_YefM, type II toxin-antitoxin system